MIKKNSFSTVEYVITLIVIVAALVGMSVYIKRAISGRWRQGADVIGFGRQYGEGVALYDCRIQHVYSCDSNSCNLNCGSYIYCTPVCYSVIGFGTSDTSMADACKKAIANLGSPICQVRSWCGWIVGYYTWEQGVPKASYYCGKTQPPF